MTYLTETQANLASTRRAPLSAETAWDLDDLHTTLSELNQEKSEDNSAVVITPFFGVVGPNLTGEFGYGHKEKKGKISTIKIN